MAQLPIHDLDWDYSLDGDMPIEAVAVVKMMDSEGRIYLAHRSTSALRCWDIIGMLRSMQLDVECQLVQDTCPADGEDAGE